MAPDPTSTPDDEPTKVSPAAGESASGAGSPSGDPSNPTPPSEAPVDVAADAPLWPDPPRVEHTTPPAPGDTAPPGSPTGGTEDSGAPGTGDRPADDDKPPADEPAAKRRRAADRTAEGAKVAADRVSQAASATAQALRETDVGEIARNTTKLIENTRPFFLAAFAIIFTFLATVENHAAIGVVFALAAVLCVLGAAFSPALDQLLKRTDRDGH